MAVASLVFGILGFVVFSWLGPLLGVTWAGWATTQSFIAAGKTGQAAEIVTWPLWFLGLTMGVGIPLFAAILGGISLAKDKAKGVAIGGLVTGIVGALGGLMCIFIFQGLASLGQAAMGDSEKFQQQIQDLQKQLDDPAIQQHFQDQLQKAIDRQKQQDQQQPGQPQPMQPQPMQPQPMQPQPMQPVQPQPAQPQPAQPQPAQPQPEQPQQ